jgi:arsenical pump membrane protein
VRTAIVGAALLVVAGVLLLTGVLPADDAIGVGQRVWPVLLFVVAITVVTELAAEAELFRVIAEAAARVGRGRAWALWLLVVVLAVASTVFLSLDTTAVLLTPIVVVLARHSGLSPLPFALTTVWLANTASLLLPVSNLTNLLAEHQLPGYSPLDFARLMALPALVAIAVPCLLLFVIYRRQLLTGYAADERRAPRDRVLFWSSAIVVAALLPALVSGVAVWIPACTAALILVAVFVLRRRSALRVSLLPWQIVLLVAGLFLVVQAGHAVGLAALLETAAGRGDAAGDLLRLAASGAVGGNLANNLPAYLALEPVAASPTRLAALLIGTNAGPLVTPWASLATLLWHQRLVALDVEFSWRRYALLGLLVVPLTLVPAVLVIAH